MNVFSLLPERACNPLVPQPFAHAYLERMNRLNQLNRKLSKLGLTGGEHEEKTPARQNAALPGLKTRSLPGSRDSNSTLSQGAGSRKDLPAKGMLTEMLLRDFALRLAKEKGVNHTPVPQELRLINRACKKILATSRAEVSDHRTLLGERTGAVD